MCKHDYELSDHFARRVAQRFGLAGLGLDDFAEEIVGAIRGDNPRMIAFDGDPAEGKRRFCIRDKVGKKAFEVIATVDDGDAVRTLVTILPPRASAKLRRHGRRYKLKDNGPRPAAYADYIRLFGKAPAGMETTA